MMQFYYSGQEILGQVEFSLTEAKKYKFVELRLLGRAVVEIYELIHNQATGTSERREHRATETYVDKTLDLWDQRLSPERKIGPGNFSFPFQFTLPKKCQSSYPKPGFELLGTSSIEYSLCAKIVTGEFLTIDPKVTIPLKVRKVTDSNRPNFMWPSHQSRHMQVGCCCCTAGELQFSVDVPRTGACIGKNFPMTVNVQNSSSRRGIYMSASIQRKWTYHVGEFTKEKYDTIASAASPEIDPYSEYTWEVDNFVIPFDALPTMEECDLLKTEDTLYVTANIPWGIDESVSMPVFIGNVPFQA